MLDQWIKIVKNLHNKDGEHYALVKMNTCGCLEIYKITSLNKIEGYKILYRTDKKINK